MESSTISKTQYVNRDELIKIIIDETGSILDLLPEAIHTWYFENADEEPETFIRRWMKHNDCIVDNSEEFMPYVRILYALDSLSAIEITKTINITFKEIKP